MLDIEEIKLIQKTIPHWIEEFETAEFEKKKVMLEGMVKRIDIFKDRIDMKFKFDLSKTLGVLKGVDWEYNSTHIASQKASYNISKTGYFKLGL